MGEENNKINRFLADIIRTQPDSPRIVCRLFESLGFLNMRRLMSSSQNITTFLEDAERALGSIEVPQDDHYIAYIRASVPPGTNPLDFLSVKSGRNYEGSAIYSKQFFIQIGRVYDYGRVNLLTLRSGKGNASVLELENRAAINYLLEERHKSAA